MEISFRRDAKQWWRGGEACIYPNAAGLAAAGSVFRRTVVGLTLFGWTPINSRVTSECQPDEPLPRFRRCVRRNEIQSRLEWLALARLQTLFQRWVGWVASTVAMCGDLRCVTRESGQAIPTIAKRHSFWLDGLWRSRRWAQIEAPAVSCNSVNGGQLGVKMVSTSIAEFTAWN